MENHRTIIIVLDSRPDLISISHLIVEELDQFVNWSSQKRNWRAIRVDLISSRWSQYATALLGWTGNKQYNRALREHSKKLGYLLSNTKLVEKKHVRAVID